jgi:hypothetical protein
MTFFRWSGTAQAVEVQSRFLTAEAVRNDKARLIGGFVNLYAAI